MLICRVFYSIDAKLLVSTGEKVFVVSLRFKAKCLDSYTNNDQNCNDKHTFLFDLQKPMSFKD